MAVILQMTFPNVIFLHEICCILIQISQTFFHKGPIYKKTSIGLDNGLVLNRWQVIICTCDNLEFTDAYMHHLGWMS